MKPRRTEAFLLLLVSLLTTAFYALASLGQTATVPQDLLVFLGAVFGLLLLAHVATRIWCPLAHPALLPLAGLLNGIGYVMLARLDPGLARLQASWTAAAILAFAGTLLVLRNPRQLADLRYTMMFVALGLLFLPMVPGVGRTVNGARIWVRVGPMNFQPGELAKVALAIFIAGYLAERRELIAAGSAASRLGLPQPRQVAPLVFALAIALTLLMAERDLGSSLLFFTLFLGTLWVATGRLDFLITGIAAFAVGAWYAAQNFGHVHARVTSWLDPWKDAADSGYQMVQSTFAFGSGGIFGRGLGLGSPQKVPAVTTDFIFSAIGEELGLIGTTAVVIAFLLIIAIGLRAAISTSDPFNKLLAAALTLAIGIQTFVIIAGVTRLLPLTGITLPFISYGGSSLVANYMVIAILMTLSARRSTT